MQKGERMARVEELNKKLSWLQDGCLESTLYAEREVLKDIALSLATIADALTEEATDETHNG